MDEEELSLPLDESLSESELELEESLLEDELELEESLLEDEDAGARRFAFFFFFVSFLSGRGFRGAGSRDSQLRLGSSGGRQGTGTRR